MELQDKLKTLQARQKDISSKRENIIREAGIEERKLQEAYERLHDLDVVDPENMTLAELEELATELNDELEGDIDLLDSELEKGETLLRQYSQV